jgi:hypothetical protein
MIVFCGTPQRAAFFCEDKFKIAHVPCQLFPSVHHLFWKRLPVEVCLKSSHVLPRVVAATLLFALPSLGRTQTHASATQTAQVHHAATLEGDWAGSLQAGDAVLHLVLHVSKAPDGSYKATIDSLDQGVYGIEVTSLTLVAPTLKLSVSSVGAAYEGKILANFTGIEGLWSQGVVSLPLAFRRQAAGAGAKKPTDAIASSEGVWQGALTGHGMRLRFQLHVSHDDHKQLVAALDSPDQKVSGLPATKVSQKDDVFHFEIPVVEGVYEGTLNATRNTITGTWTQNGSPRNLEFKRSDKLLELSRPQDPVKPYPYREEEITFANDAAKISLAGSLTIPQGSGPFPAAILISGSGPHDRDELLDGHRPFLVLADHLTRNGIAVLRFDKRGIGKSTGNYEQAVTEDFAADTEAALAYLKTRKELDPKKIGLIGHSEGGLIAPLVAAHSQDVAWIVLLAGPGVKGEEVLVEQSEAMLRAAGVPDGEIFRIVSFNKKSYELVREEKDPAALEAKLNDLAQSTSTGAAIPANVLKAQIRVLLSPWFRAFLDYDPVPALQKTACPVLALSGEKDLQVPPKENLSKIKKALEDGGSKDFQATELPGLNHLFQHAPTGSPTEYGAIEETMAPEALNAVSDWIKKHTAP